MADDKNKDEEVQNRFTEVEQDDEQPTSEEIEEEREHLAEGDQFGADDEDSPDRDAVRYGYGNTTERQNKNAPDSYSNYEQ